jgi:hypothetical protein
MSGLQPGAVPGLAGSTRTEPRPTDLRLARLHLRMGSLDLARAELEAFAGSGSLDPEALLDLAEVRWRTGDLGGAGVAADAYLATEDEAPVALAIAAEAAAAGARYAEARRLAARAVEMVGDDLDALFAGMPRSAIWPADRYAAAVTAGALFGDEPSTRTASEEAFLGAVAPEPMIVETTGVAGEDASGATPGEVSGQPGLWEPDAPELIGPAGIMEPSDGEQGRETVPGVASLPALPVDDLAPARQAMAAGDQAEAARRLAELIRERPDLAAVVLGTLPGQADGGLDRSTDEPGGRPPADPAIDDADPRDP